MKKEVVLVFTSKIKQMEGKVTISSRVKIDKVSNNDGDLTQGNDKFDDVKDNLNSKPVGHASNSTSPITKEEDMELR